MVQHGGAQRSSEAVVPFGFGRAGRIAAIVGLACVHLLATGSTLTRGPNATAALGYAVFVVLCGVLLGRRALWIAAALVAAASGLVAGLLFGEGWPPTGHELPRWDGLDGWAHTAAAFGVLTAVLCAPVAFLIRRFERSLAEGEQTLVLLEEERAAQERAEASRRKSEAAVAQAQRSQVVGRVGAALAHQFNNALVVIRGEAEALRDGATSEAGQAAATAAILAASRRATLLTQKLLALARPGSARPSVSDVGRCVGELARIAAQFLPADLTLSVRSAPGLRAAIGEGQLEQVLINLVLNARDAMPGGGRIEVIAERAGSRGEAGQELVRLTVKDAGPGISGEARAHLFEPFFTTKREGLGVGLGLVSTRQIVEGAGGRIEVESAAGRGTEVIVLLPAATPTEAEGPAEAKRILLLDPDRRARALSAAALRQQGLLVVDANSTPAALEQVRRQRGNLDLLCVCGEPGTPGVANVIEEFRVLHPGAPVLLLEAAPVPAAELLSRALGLLGLRRAPTSVPR